MESEAPHTVAELRREAPKHRCKRCGRVGHKARACNKAHAQALHPRSPYNAKARKQRTFKQLAQRPGAEALQEALGSSVKLDFTRWQSNKALTQALLAVDFGLTRWELPHGCLVPPVPNRLNYLLWIEDLLALAYPDSPTKGSHRSGLDVGTGASAIYTLLGASHFGWSMVATDCDMSAVQSAHANAQRHTFLSHLIKTRKVHDCSRPLFGSLHSDFAESFDFCVCNPPFFSSESESGSNPANECGGTPTEVCCKGGEEAFTSALFIDSISLKRSVLWFSTMCGKKRTLQTLKARLREEPTVTALRTTELMQGNISRWAIAWSFSEIVRGSDRIPIRPEEARHARFHATHRKSFILKQVQSLPHAMERVRDAFAECGCSINDSVNTVPELTGSLAFEDADNGAERRARWEASFSKDDAGNTVVIAKLDQKDESGKSQAARERFGQMLSAAMESIVGE
jgi:23S rRNA (adenine1618-N6)-methyltransferase